MMDRRCSTCTSISIILTSSLKYFVISFPRLKIRTFRTTSHIGLRIVKTDILLRRSR